MHRYVFCPNCGATRDVCGDYTSPANRALDARGMGEGPPIRSLRITVHP